MKLFNSFKGLFNSRSNVAFTREELAQALAPFVNPHKPYENESLEKAFDELSEWLRIGFAVDSDTGTSYQAMRVSLKFMASAARDANPAVDTILFNPQHVRALAHSHWQLIQAADYLDAQEYRKQHAPVQKVQDKFGNTLTVPPAQIYNQPYADYYAKAECLREIQSNLKTLFAQKPQSAPSDHEISAYIHRHPYIK